VKFSRKIAKAADAMIMEFKKNSASGRSSIYREGLNLLLGIDRQDLPINSWKIADKPAQHVSGSFKVIEHGTIQ